MHLKTSRLLPPGLLQRTSARPDALLFAQIRQANVPGSDTRKPGNRSAATAGYSPAARRSLTNVLNTSNGNVNTCLAPALIAYL